MQVRRGGVGIEADEIVSNEDRGAAVMQLRLARSVTQQLDFGDLREAVEEGLITPVLDALDALDKVRQLAKIAISLGQVMSSYARMWVPVQSAAVFFAPQLMILTPPSAMLSSVIHRAVSKKRRRIL
jgi:hypothetical protein